jgi:hypothetical protein
MTDTAISANKHIYSLLTADTQLMSAVSGNIYPLVAEESVSYPFIIFTKESVNGNYTKDFLIHDTAVISVAVAARNYFQTVQIAERVRAVLEGYRDSYFNSIQLENVSEDFIEDAYIQHLQFTTKINVN